MNKYNKTIIENSTLYLGDCLEVMKIIPDKSIDCIITDPPYSLGYDFENDKLSYSKQAAFMEKYLKLFYGILKDNGTVCIFMSQEMSHYLYIKAKKIGFTWQNEIIWNRDGGQMPTKKIGICHENICIYTKGSLHKTFNLNEIRVKSKYAELDKRLNENGKNPGDVWYVPALFGKKIERIKGPNGKALHPTQKPIDIVFPLLWAYTNKNDLVLDTFMGTGTVGAACKKINRKYIGIELEKEFFKASISRLNKSTIFDD